MTKRIQAWFALAVLLEGAAFAASILAYGPSHGAADTTYLTNAGHTVTEFDGPTWLAASAATFAGFDALYFGDDDCGAVDAETGAFANQSVWGPVIKGRVFLHTFDDHFPGNAANRYDELVAACANWATGGDGTGLCMSFQCTSDTAGAHTIPGVGTFSTDEDDGDAILIEDATHPTMAGLTNEELDCWGDSVHDHFPTYPSDYVLLAVDAGACEESALVGSAAVVGAVHLGGEAVIIAREARLSGIEIPALGKRGLLAITLLLASAAIVVLRNRRTPSR